MKKTLLTLPLVLALALPGTGIAQQTVGEVCRSYALAIEAVAKARDNLDDPSWEKLLEQHPVLQKDGKNDRAVLYAQLINLRVINKNATPQALKTNAYETCPTNYLCMFRNVDCPTK